VIENKKPQQTEVIRKQLLIVPNFLPFPAADGDVFSIKPR
jgi:hypothetical protein